MKKYTLNEFKKIYGITKYVWESRKEELLEYLNFFFDYEIVKEGFKTYVIVKEQYKEYEPLPKKKDINKLKQHYNEQTDNIIKKDPWNTGANIARNIIAMDQNVYNHQEATIAKYVRPIIKDQYIQPGAPKEWRRLSKDRLSYEPLTDEQLEFLTNLLDDNSGQKRKKREIEKMAEYNSGYITKEELKDFLYENLAKSYGTLMAQFKEKFGFWLQRIICLSKDGSDFTYIPAKPGAFEWEDEAE